MIAVLAHFFYAISIWGLLSEISNVSHIAPFERSSYLFIVGILKYAPLMLFSALGGFAVSKYFSKGKLLLLLVGTACCVLFLEHLNVGVYAYFLLLGVLMMMKVVYEPFVEVLSAYHAEKRNDYIVVNSWVKLGRTSARFIAPLLILFSTGAALNISLFQFVSFFLLAAAVSFFFVDIPDQGLGQKKLTFRASVKEVLSNRVALALLVMYCVFYLSVNYLEYFVVLADEKPGRFLKVQHLYASLGAGFVVSNLSFIVTKLKKSPLNKMLSFSLILTAASVTALPFSNDLFLLVFTFLMGIGNGMSVPIFSAISQKELGKTLVGSFTGLVNTGSNICALFSMGFGYFAYELFGKNGVFILDGLFVLLSAILWLLLSTKKFPVNNISL